VARDDEIQGSQLDRSIAEYSRANRVNPRAENEMGEDDLRSKRNQISSSRASNYNLAETNNIPATVPNDSHSNRLKVRRKKQKEAANVRKGDQRARETEYESIKRRQHDALTHRLSRENEDEDASTQRRQLDAINHRLFRENEDEEASTQRRQLDEIAHREARVNEAADERVSRLSDQRNRQRQHRIQKATNIASSILDNYQQREIAKSPPRELSQEEILNIAKNLKDALGELVIETIMTL